MASNSAASMQSLLPVEHRHSCARLFGSARARLGAGSLPSSCQALCISKNSLRRDRASLPCFNLNHSVCATLRFSAESNSFRVPRVTPLLELAEAADAPSPPSPSSLSTFLPEPTDAAGAIVEQNGYTSSENLLITVLFVLAALGLAVLTAGVGYLLFADWRDKQEVEKFQKEQGAPKAVSKQPFKGEVSEGKSLAKASSVLPAAKGFGKKGTDASTR